MSDPAPLRWRAVLACSAGEQIVSNINILQRPVHAASVHTLRRQYRVYFILDGPVCMRTCGNAIHDTVCVRGTGLGIHTIDPVTRWICARSVLCARALCACRLSVPSQPRLTAKASQHGRNRIQLPRCVPQVSSSSRVPPPVAQVTLASSISWQRLPSLASPQAVLALDVATQHVQHSHRPCCGPAGPAVTPAQPVPSAHALVQ